MRIALALALCGCNAILGVHDFGAPSDGSTDGGAPGTWAKVAVGAGHVCGIDTSAHLACWGEGFHGQLGLPEPSLAPRLVDGGTWTDVAAAVDHTCAVRDGNAYCWGNNGQGQVTGVIGTDVTIATQVALPVGTPPVEKVAIGNLYSCALGGGEISCWGDTRVTGMSNMPTAIVGATWSKIAGGVDHVCALDIDGGTWCWGANDGGQTGQAASARSLPARVSIAASIEIGAGWQTSCAVLATGQLWCWGSSYSGIVVGVESPPEQVVAGSDWTGVAIGGGIACGLKGDAASCFGAAQFGGFGDGRWAEQIAATALGVPIHADVLALARGLGGEETACAIANGNLACWGDNRGGQLGFTASLTGVAQNVTNPMGVAWMDVAVGATHTCARDRNSALWCWGADDLGQVSGAACASASCDHSLAVAAPHAAASAELVAGNDFTCVHDGAGIDCWGSNALGALGSASVGDHQATTPLVLGAKLVGGGGGACFAGPMTRVSCWGDVNGTATFTPTLIPDPNMVLGDIGGVALGHDAAAAIETADIRRVAWGYGYFGELGDGVLPSGSALATEPKESADDAYTAISMLFEHACGLTMSGGVKCWGTNYDAESGATSATLMVASPNPVLMAPGVALGSCTAVSTNSYASCALCGGKPWCWGDNQLGQLARATSGDPIAGTVSFTGSSIPTGTWVSLGSGKTHSCAASTNGTLACWGFGVRGQLGNGGHGSNTPVAIAAPQP